MAAPATLARARVASVVEDEFSAEGWTVEDDRLLRACGRDGRDRIACFPRIEEEDPRTVIVLRVSLVLQIYLAYSADIDENQAVDPTLIEGYADRLRRAFAGANSSGNTSDMWFLRLTRVTYPEDPTGNISRLEAEILAQCDNPASLP